MSFLPNLFWIQYLLQGNHICLTYFNASQRNDILLDKLVQKPIHDEVLNFFLLLEIVGIFWKERESILQPENSCIIYYARCAKLSLRQKYACCLIGPGSGGLKINDQSSTFLSGLSDIKILMWQNFSLPREHNVLREYSIVLDDYDKISMCLKTRWHG